MFSRADWTIFRNLSTITHKAGVPLGQLRSLVMKELADNALDASQKTCEIGMSGRWYYVEDKGEGIPGTPEEVATLFSIKRPLTSSKIVRKPSRGALGNGLRVVAGVVLASGGELVVHTRGKRIKLALHDDGTSTPEEVTPSHVSGTRVEVLFGDSVPSLGKAVDLMWATIANNFSFAEVYQGNTSSWWYDSDSFFELLKAADGLPLRKLLEQFDSLRFEKRDNWLLDNSDLDTCEELDRTRADELLAWMREQSPKRVDPKKIGRAISNPEGMPYHKMYGEIEILPGRGIHKAVLPYCVEAYAKSRGKDDNGKEYDNDYIIGMVNGTPITGELTIERRGKTEVAVFGCGLHHKITRVSQKKFILHLNITIPYMPITTDGKAPDFKRFLHEIGECTRKATRKLKHAIQKTGEQTGVIVNNLEAGIQKASGNGKFRYSLRQLFYAIRPYVMEEASDNKELDYSFFSRVISRIENDSGKDLPGMYRDPRGMLYHPHLGRSIPIGTIAVEEYEQPKWTFNKVLYCEKEGFFSILQALNWPERWDCALLSSKGFASRAVRDLLDLMGDTEEEIQFFCIHDADNAGTLIYETLCEQTIARKARKVKIIDLGLNPWEALAAGLQVETFESKSKRPVASYVKYHRPDYELDFPSMYGIPDNMDQDGEFWEEWLQTNRVELNSMTSPEFVKWLDEKMQKHAKQRKVIPPEQVMRQTLLTRTEQKLRSRLANEILQAAGLDIKVAGLMSDIKDTIATADVNNVVSNDLDDNPENRWIDPLDKLADQYSGGD